MTPLPAAVLRDLAGMLGDAGALASSADTQRYERGYRYGHGRALAIARPGTTDEVAKVVRYCVAHDLGLVAQGANTGLVGASTPDGSGAQLLLSLDRLRGIESIDPHNRTAQVLAGTRLSELNAAAQAHSLFFPIDLGADPSLGGMVATNTGGSRLLRYGDVQKNLLGLEVVLADPEATVLADLRGLRKDNSGIDLKQLFVGTSGHFGVITRVQVELHRLPAQSVTAMVVPTEHAAIPALLALLEAEAGEFLAAFEGMSANALRAAFRHNPRLRNPFDQAELPPYATLIELSSSLRGDRLDLPELLAHILGEAMEAENPLVANAYFGRAEDLWAIRHSISDGMREAGSVIGFDISVPRSTLPALRAGLIESLRLECPTLQVYDFGHCGDGGDHFNLVWPHDAGARDDSMIEKARLLVYDRVMRGFNGSFSAEHGVGPHNIAYYRRYTGSAEKRLASGLKKMCDPKGLLGNTEFGLERNADSWRQGQVIGSGPSAAGSSIRG